MFKKIISFYKKKKHSSEYRKILTNFSFLSIVNLANYILPLLTLPYLINVLGSEAFGQVMFAQAFTQYFITIVDYGFNFSTTRDIALNKEDHEKVSEIFCSVILLKSIFFLLSFIVLIILIFTIDKFSSFPIIYILTFMVIIGNVLFPTWFFQGIEQMKYITIVNLSSKIASAFFIFTLIKSKTDILFVPIIYACCSIVPSVIVLFYARKVYPLHITLPTLTKMKNQLKQGWFIFLSSFSTSLYSISNTFLLGILFNNSFAGYYSFAEKIIRACTSVFIPLNNALFPFMSLKMKESPGQGELIFKKSIIVLILVSGFGSIVLYFASDFLLNFIKSDFYPSIEVLKIVSPLLMIVAISNLIGFQFLFTTGKEKKYLISVFIAGILNIFFFLLLSQRFLYKAPAISLLISEAFICFTFIFYSRRILFNRL